MEEYFSVKEISPINSTAQPRLTQREFQEIKIDLSPFKALEQTSSPGPTPLQERPDPTNQPQVVVVTASDRAKPSQVLTEIK